MQGMFYANLRESKFNQPIGNWNTTAVIDMSYMFAGAEAFNQAIGNWNTAKVTTMSHMFYSAGAFNSRSATGTRPP